METLKNQIIKRNKFETTLLDGGIIYFRYFENLQIEAEDILESFKVHDILKVGDDIKRIVHSERFSTITKEARNIVQNYSRPAKAEAFVIPSVAQKIVFNLFHKMRKQQHPIKAFDNLEDALDWIQAK